MKLIAFIVSETKAELKRAAGYDNLAKRTIERLC